jgi:transcriptional regulator with PAS, ATPase and Fis domain
MEYRVEMASDDGPLGSGLATEKLFSDEGRHLLVRQFRLCVVDGPDQGATWSSTGPRGLVGTHQSANFVLSDRAVSRFHCEISFDEAGPLVRDLESSNGTRVQGVSVLHARLDDGALLTLGNTQLRFELAEEQLKIPLSDRSRFGPLVGQSVAMRSLFALLERAAASDATVLLEGETGTGKEAAAEAIHAEGARRDGPFVVVDCGAIPAELLESELFGHERGACTGAVAARQGAFAAAHHGTIFLDELGELPADLQPKLLRALERRQVKRVGADHFTPVDVRVVAATNRNLRAEVNAKRFRSDLYYRLAVLELRLPPLRDHKEDLPLLIDETLGQLGAAGDSEAARLRTPAFVSRLARYAWPGNVRELRNYLERCLALRDHAPLLGSPLPESSSPTDPRLPLKEAREAFDRQYLEQVLAQHSGNLSAAARAAGIDRAAFYRLLWRHGLR